MVLLWFLVVNLAAMASCGYVTQYATFEDPDMLPRWKAGVFCGRYLNAMGWKRYENDTMYQCGEVPNNVTVIARCRNDTCNEQTCDCIPRQTYCGYQLYQMGWTNVNVDLRMTTFVQCDASGKNVNLISACHKCTSFGGHAKCTCEDTVSLYCGHEMDPRPPYKYDDNATYQCNGDGNATFMQACQGRCTRLSAKLLACLGTCNPGDRYCGSKLHELGFTGLNIDNIYSCSGDGQNLTDTGRVDPLCTHCTPGQTYCGHQIDHTQHLSKIERQQRYACKWDGTLQRTGACFNCINRGTGAYCQCLPGFQYCGSEIYTNGLQGFGGTSRKSANFTNDTLFRCDEETNLQLVDHCGKEECLTSSKPGASTCRCVPGRTYCGHELFPSYSPLNLHRIYNCSDDGIRSIRKCVACVSINGNVQCRHPCIPNSRYCGSDLLGLEGWDGMDSQTLYQCASTLLSVLHGSFVSAEQNCTNGCQPRNGEFDAYCFGKPAPWYAFFIVIALPALLIVLCICLVRTIIKHRRLRKFVRQHRINASQLTLLRKLGHGQFGEVWQGVFTDNGEKTDVALKISKHSLNSNPA